MVFTFRFGNREQALQTWAPVLPFRKDNRNVTPACLSERVCEGGGRILVYTGPHLIFDAARNQRLISIPLAAIVYLSETVAPRGGFPRQSASVDSQLVRAARANS